MQDEFESLWGHLHRLRAASLRERKPPLTALEKSPPGRLDIVAVALGPADMIALEDCASECFIERDFPVDGKLQPGRQQAPTL
jgi:hypothetical protein